MTKGLLLKFLNNQCTGEELDLITRWIKANALNNDSLAWNKEEWDNTELANEFLENDEKYKLLLDRIHHKININTAQKSRKLSVKDRLNAYSKWISRAAAVLLLPVLILLFLSISGRIGNQQHFTDVAVDTLEVSTPVGSRTYVRLSDGTEVYLNYGSKIRYPHNFVGETREVKLTGEGYFKVAQDKERPFIVKAAEINVKAVGTEFNVEAYPDLNEINTSLVEGKVIVEKSGDEGKVQTLGAMVPGQYVSYNQETGSIISKQGNIDKYIAWKEGRLVFENEPISRVASVLSRMYNVDFKIEDDAKFYTYTVTFVDETLSQILELMKIATPIDYKILPRVKLSDGTFSKQKVIINRKVKKPN